MYPVTGVVGGLRNGFNRYRMANHEQPFHIDEDGYLGYPNVVLNNGHRTPTPMSCMPGIAQGALASAQDAIFDNPIANNDRRRRSSTMSPRTIREPAYRTPYSNSFPGFDRQNVTPPNSNNFTGHATQEQVVAEPNSEAFNRPSISTISTTIRTSTASAYTETPGATHSDNQRVLFALLSDICTEALRRKWHDQTQRQSIRTMASRRSRPSRQRRGSRGGYSPYAPLSAVPNPHSHNSQRTRRAGAAAAMAERPLGFMELMQRIATAMWEEAIQAQQEQSVASRRATSGSLETAAIDSMRTLYSLGSSIMAASLAARGESFNLDEIRDIVGLAAGFCRVLGYAEGAERCEEVGRYPFNVGPEQEGLWEGVVL